MIFKRNCILLYFFTILINILLQNLSLTAGSAGTNYTYETQYLVNMPTAGLIPKSSQLFSMNFSGKSGMMVAAEYSPINNASLGISFGGIGILGNETIKFQEYPGILAKYRFLNESKYFPAIALGFNSQGFGIYDDVAGEYQINSPGFYLAFSKSFKWDYGFYAIHMGTNYSLEPKSSNRRVNAYFGFEHTIANRASVNFEYNFNSPKNSGYNLMEGMSSLGLRYSIEKISTIELKLVDLFGTRGEMQRFLKIEFVGFLF